MNKYCQRIITICVIVMTIFIILSYCKINTIIKMDYSDGYSNRSVLNNLDLNVVRIETLVRDIYSTVTSTDTNIKHYLGN